jgi:predicted DNA-binding transcriptional regulator YafY
MSRAKRLLELLENLRHRKYPVTAAALAAELGISTRSLYRDIATLQAQGARIDGAAGLGYVLKPGFTLPPLMFEGEEIEALVLGARWVSGRTDERLAEAAARALGKIAAVLPPEQRDILDGSTLMVPPGYRIEGGDAPVADLRKAIRGERKVTFAYKDVQDRESQRTVWPFAMAYFDAARLVVAWCELRKGFRNFRTDRIRDLKVLEEKYPRRRQALLDEWRALQGIPAD